MMADPLDASLADYLPPSPPLTQEALPKHEYGYPSAHSGFRSESDEEEEEGQDPAPRRSVASGGGYSPPAWRRLGNGDRSSGFWRRPDAAGGFGGFEVDGRRSRESSPEAEEDSMVRDLIDELDLDAEGEGDEVLERAVRTRLPTGSLSPEKGGSPEPERAREVKRERSVLEAVEEEKEDEERDGKKGLKDVGENCEFISFSPLSFVHPVWKHG